MSEIKGQILGIILVLMVFGVVSAAMVAIFANLTKDVENHVSQIESSLSNNDAYVYSELMSY